MPTDEDQPSPRHVGQVLADVFDLKKYAGIETVYRGIEFRSRLEARWACFFDQCGWRWNYEPFDLAGWIPDFSLGKTGLLVEVKPFLDLDQFGEAITKAKKALGSSAREILLVGESPFLGHYATCIGWIGEVVQFDDSWEWRFDPARCGIPYKRKDHHPTLCTINGGWDDRISGIWDGAGLQPNDSQEWIDRLWADACNITKWKPSDGRGNR